MRVRMPLPRVMLPALLAVGPVVLLAPALPRGRTILPGAALRHFMPSPGTRDDLPATAWNALQWDALAQYYPWRVFARRWLRRGILPLWNPHEFCGTPFLANGQSAILYPLNWLYLIFHPVDAFDWTALLRLLIAGCGVYVLCRRLGCRPEASTIGGLCFALGGAMVTWLLLPAVGDVVAWMPWALWAVEGCAKRRSASCGAWLAVFIGLALLAGHGQMMLYLMGLIVARVVCLAVEAGDRGPRLTRLAGAAVCVGLLLGMGQALPTMEFLQHNHRRGAPTAAGLRGYRAAAMPPRLLTTMLAPYFWGRPAEGTYLAPALPSRPTGNYADYCGFAGLVGLLLAGGAMAMRPAASGFWTAMAVAGGLLSVGWKPIAWLVYFGVPGMSQSGTPSRALCVVTLSVAVLASLGAEALFDGLTPRRWGGCCIGAAVVAALLLLARADAARTLPRAVAAVATPVQMVSMVTAGALLAGFLLIVGICAVRRVSPQAGLALCGLLVAADMLRFAWGYNPTSATADVYPRLPAVESVAAQPDRRLLVVNRSWPLWRLPDAVLPPNGCLAYGVDEAAGYDSLQTARYKAYAAIAEGRNPSPPANGNMVLLSNIDSPLWDAAAVTHFLAHAPPATPRRNALPRARLVRPVPGAAEDASRWLEHGLLDLRHRAIIEGPAVVAPLGSPGDGRCSYHRDEPSVCRVNLSPPVSGMLFVADSYYPGWRGAVDGRVRPLRIANLTFRALPVHAGDREVIMVFWPQSVRLGLYLTCLGLALLSAMVVHARRRRRG